jgi:gamma-glutamyltranspeptidase/glutathione hydrolase
LVLCALPALLALAACGPSARIAGTPPPGFTGAVVTDDATMTRIGHEMLEAGGSAADAVVAAVFTGAVTLPSRIGLGGGGVCVARADDGRAESIAFGPRPTQGGRMGEPLLARGMAALSLGFGKLGWERQLEPGENLARAGVRIGRALAADLAEPDSLLRLDPTALGVFAPAGTQVLPEGAPVTNPALAATIARLRRFGAGDLYQGQLAARFLEGAVRVGGDLRSDALRAAPVTVTPTGRIDVAGRGVLLPATPGGRVAADVLAQASLGGYATLDQPARIHLLAEAARAALAEETASRAGRATADQGLDRARRLAAGFTPTRAGPPRAIDLATAAPPVATVIAAVDWRGSAVACALTQGPRFASGRVAGDTGILIGPPTPPAGLISLVPLLILDTDGRRVLAVGAAGGQTAAPVAAGQLALGLLVEGRAPDVLLERPRMSHDGRAVLLENFGGDSAEALEARGHRLTVLDQESRMSAIHCPGGLPDDRTRCQVATDPRGHGFGR